MALLVVTGLLVLAGCGGSDDDGGKAAGRAPTSAPTSTQPAQASRPLPAGWYEDPDDDLVPTAVEEKIGTDPNVDECAQKSGCKDAGVVSALEKSNTLLILDSSGSMAASAGGGITKLDAAKRALRRYVAGTPDSLALGFMVYGHKGSNGPAGKAASCAGVQLLQPIGTAASRRFDQTLDQFKPTGYTPLAASLRKARDAFAGKEDAINRIILVTDGIETCGGDPVAEARKLKQAGIKVTTDVVGFDVSNPDEARRLRAITEASGGTYTDASSNDALNAYFDDQRKRIDDLNQQILCVKDKANDLGLCQRNAVNKAELYMGEASNNAYKADRTAQGDEIDRLRSQLDKASSERTDALLNRSGAEADRLLRELDEAQKRLIKLTG